MPEYPDETPKNRGCKCGWPIDSCCPSVNPNLKDGDDCPRVKNEREIRRYSSKTGLVNKASDAERDAAFYRRTADLIQVRER